MDFTDEKESVLQAHAENRAITALLTAVGSKAIVNARFDRQELTLWIARDQIRAAAKTLQDAGYNFLVDVTCVDWYPNEPRFQVTYHILSHSFKERVRLCVLVESPAAEVAPEVASVTPVWPAANFYEREIWDLFGVRFSDHPDLRRIMMPDEWVGHPLRKDYPVEGYR